MTRDQRYDVLLRTLGKKYLKEHSEHEVYVTQREMDALKSRVVSITPMGAVDVKEWQIKLVHPRNVKKSTR